MTSAPVSMARPPSEQLVDLHVYLVPKEVWNEAYRSAYNDVIHQTVSAGFVRVWPELSLYYLRNQIIEQLGDDALPSQYVFLKSVGRCLTQVKAKQELELKVKSFIPPQAPLPEMFVLEAKRDPLNLAAFTNHERMDLIVEESVSSPKEEPANTEKNETETGQRRIQQAVPSDKQSRQNLKPSKIPRRVKPAGTKIGGQASKRQTGGQSGTKTRVRTENRSGSKAGQAGGVLNRAGQRVGQAGRPQPAGVGKGGPQVARRLAGGSKPRGPAAGTSTASVRLGQARKGQGSAGSGPAGGPAAGLRQTSLGSRGRERQSVLQAGNPGVAPGQTREITRQERRDRAGISQGVKTEQEHTAGSTAGQVKGGVPPLHLQQLESVKGVDPSTPLKSGRLDTYTNDTNQDSGIAELTPDRNELDYGRQRSDSLERKQTAERQYTPVALGSGRPEDLDDRLKSAEASGLDRLQQQQQDSPRLQSNAAAQEAERPREEDKEWAGQRERQIQEAAARELAEKQRHLESAQRREMERWEREKGEEEERERLVRARQQELEMQRRVAAVAAAKEAEARQQAAAAAAAATEEESQRQRLLEEESQRQRLLEEAEELELEEEIRRRQADELRQSRQMSRDQSRRRELEQFTPLSQQAGSRQIAGSRQQRDLYHPHTRDSIRRERTGDLADGKLRSETSTRQSERTEVGGVFVEDVRDEAASSRNVESAGEVSSAKTHQMTQSAREGLALESERLLAEFQERQEMRFELETTREELMRQAKTLQARTTERRNKARDLWKKRYFEEKKKTNPLEEQVNRLRAQLDQQHRKLLNQLEGRGPLRKGMTREPPSKKNDHKILIFKLQHEMDDLKRRVENSKMKLTSEIKLRNQAENELRNLRTDVLQRKINVTVSRSQQLHPLKETEEKQVGVRTTPLRTTPLRTTPLRATNVTTLTPRGMVRTKMR